MISTTHVVLALLGTGLSVSAQGIVDGKKFAKDTFDAAVTFDGNYRLINVATGDHLVYTHDEQPNLFPSTDSIATILKKIAHVSNPKADDVFQLTPRTNGEPSVRIRNEESNKALAAQWSYDTGRDEYAVAYKCQVGSESECDNNLGLEVDKQYYAFVPAEANSSTRKAAAKFSVKSSSSDDDKEEKDAEKEEKDDDKEEEDDTPSGTGCTYHGDWIHRHGTKEFYRKHPECKGLAEAPTCRHPASWINQHKEYLDDHPECHDVVKSKMAKRVVTTPIAKRGEEGVYCIVVVDHILNMRPRAVSGKATKAFADAWSALIVDYDCSDPLQQWIVQKA